MVSSNNVIYDSVKRLFTSELDKRFSIDMDEDLTKIHENTVQYDLIILDACKPVNISLNNAFTPMVIVSDNQMKLDELNTPGTIKKFLLPLQDIEKFKKTVLGHLKLSQESRK